MHSDSKQKDLVKVDWFVTPKKGRKAGAIIDIEELKRIEEIFENSSYRKVIRDRAIEPAKDYEAYSGGAGCVRHGMTGDTPLLAAG